MFNNKKLNIQLQTFGQALTKKVKLPETDFKG